MRDLRVVISGSGKVGRQVAKAVAATEGMRAVALLTPMVRRGARYFRATRHNLAPGTYNRQP